MDLILNPVESYTVQRRAKQKKEERLREHERERKRKRERGGKLSELFLDYGSLIKGRRGERETDHLYHPPPMEFGFAAKLYLRVVDPEENSCGKAR